MVVFGACLGITWTIVSWNVILMFPDSFTIHAPQDVLRVTPVLPAFGSIALASTFYSLGVPAELGLALGALLTTFACAVGVLVVGRRT